MVAIPQLFRRRPRRKPAEQPLVDMPSTSICMKTFPKHEFVGHQNTVMSFVFLQDNVYIVSGSQDHTIQKWNCETGLLVWKPWKVYNAVFAMALSPDGKTIACGLGDGGVQLWDTNGEMMQGVWTGHSDWVRSLSWSPSGRHLASGSDDRTILIRKSEGGQVEIGPIKTNQRWVNSVAYSPSGDRIASGGNSTCIWDTNTGDLLVGPVKGWVYSFVWSLDGSKLYSAAGQFARILDSASGTELHRFHVDMDGWLYSIALSPRLGHNLLAGVGENGIAQLWDTESYQPLGQPFYLEHTLRCVSFSPNGWYLAYGGYDNKITLRMVGDNVPGFPLGTP